MAYIPGGGGGAPTTADYLVGTANGSLSAEIVVGTSPGGELGGTWGSPTVDATHSGSAHHTRSHAVTGASDHTAGNHKLFYSDGAGAVQELAHGATVGYVLTSNGASTAPSWEAGATGMSLIVKDTDETVNSTTTLQNDDAITFSVAANEDWQFEGTLFVNSAITPDFKLDFAGPSGATGYWGVTSWADGTVTANAHNQVGALSGSGQGLTSADWPIAIRFWGGIANGANAGSLTLQWAQNTSDAGNTTVLAGSYIKYQQVV